MADAPPPAAVAPADVLRPALLLWLAIQAAHGLYGQVMAFLWTPSTAASAYVLLHVLLYEVGYLALCVVVVRFVWRDAEARRVFARPRPRMVELCLLVGVAMALLLWAWESRIPSDGSATSPIAAERDAGWPWWVSLLASAVAPALVEEWMYRGLLLTRFLRVLSPGLAIAVQAMLFSAMHADVVMLLPHFVFGFTAGVLRVAAGALWPAMLLHLLWNAHLVLREYALL
ncbi:MAG: CPBP family intramembrane metalloprotease [Planctomycetes bacterium]|nr:CPBP family intramembrane metalloprotease [Planctomycetota bacterium]